MKRFIRPIAALIIMSVCMSSFAACSGTNGTEEIVGTDATDVIEVSAGVTTEESSEATPTPEEEPAVNPEFIGLTAEEICDLLTLEEKAAQMVQGVVYEMSTNEMMQNCYGSVLGVPTSGQVPDYAAWRQLTNSYQRRALMSDTAIPYIYGQDSVHGCNYVGGSVIFPQNINIGAANDVERTEQMGVFVGSELTYTGMRWNFAPCIAMAQDPRWGRTYESYSSTLERTRELALAYTEGLMSQGIIACPKHFFGDGYTVFGTGENSDNTIRLIDRGDAIMTQEEIDENMSLYASMVDLGVQTIMVSHSAVNGVKMHENSEYLTYLKEELGFEGVIVSDWDSVHNISGETFYEQVVNAVNAGIDMFMEPEVYSDCRDNLVLAVNNGDVSIDRINDAVIRILNMKINAGLFEDPYSENLNPAYEENDDFGRQLARTLAAESFVPLKLSDGTYRLEAGMKVFVCGPAADDTGVQCGGWSMAWNGIPDYQIGGRVYPDACTILDGLNQAAETVGYEVITDEDRIDECDLVILCVGEQPYAEWNGDANDLSIVGDLALEGNSEAIEFANNSGIPTLTLIVAGRNVIIDDYIDQWDSVIMLYLPGTETGYAVADVLTGEAPFTGTLPMPYYSSENQIGTDNYWKPVGYSAAA